MDNDNTYVIHDNETELARLQLQGALCDESMRLVPELFDAGLHPHAHVLDMGCGPGGWAIQVTGTYPEWKVTGVDVNPRMINYAHAQTEVLDLDVQFRVMDILQPLDFADASFDLVNLRFGAGFIPVAKAPAVFAECWRVLRPGGVLCNTESVHTSAPYAALHQMARHVFQAFHTAGLTYSPFEMSLSAETARLFREIGFAPVEMAPYVLDMSAGAPLYHSMREDLLISMTQLKPFLVDTMHICSTEEFDRLVEEERQMYADPHFCAHWYVCSVVGVKPA